MDYAKYAYLKAEDIEAQLRHTAATDAKRNVLAASFYPHAALESGYAPCVVSGVGHVGVTVSLCLRAPQGAQKVKVWLYCGDMPAAYTVVSADEGAYTHAVLLASVTPSGGETLRVVADREGLLLEEMHVLADGNGVTVSVANSGCRADCLDGRVYLAREKNGILTVSAYGADATVDAAHAAVFDVCAADGELHVLCSDDDGNLWGISYDAELQETNRVHLGEGMDDVAIGCHPSGYVLAACKNKKLYLAQCGSRFSGMTDWECASFGAGADAVYLSKQAQNAALFFRKDGTVYAKLPTAASGVRACIVVAPAIEIL